MYNHFAENDTYPVLYTCRTCLKKLDRNGLNSAELFFNTDEHNLEPSKLVYRAFLSGKLRGVLNWLNIKISLDDSLPHKICNDCETQLNNFYTFKTICDTSQSVLTKHFLSYRNTDIKQKRLSTECNTNNESTHTKTVTVNTIIPDYVQSQFSQETCKNDSDNDYPIDTDDGESVEYEIEFLPVEDHETDYEIRNANEIVDENEVECWIEKVTKNQFVNKYDNQIETHNEEHTGHLVDDNGNSNNEFYDKVNEDISYNNSDIYITHDDGDQNDVNDYGGETITNLVSVNDLTSVTVNIKQKFACKICDKHFSAEVSLKRHMKEKICSLIDKEYNNEEILEQVELQQLQNEHVKDKPYLCPICKKSFRFKQLRNSHILSHNQEKQFECDICNQHFTNKRNIMRHMTAKHANEEFQCPYCSYIVIGSKQRFRYHLKTHDAVKKYQCKYCVKSFLQPHHLHDHERTHTGAKPFLCFECGKCFALKNALTRHQIKHGGEKPFVCKICNKGFIEKSMYDGHMNKHNGIYPFQCNQCDKKYTTKSALYIHLLRHSDPESLKGDSDAKSYKCETCDRSFATPQSYKRHPCVDNDHHQDRPDIIYSFNCDFCGKGFQKSRSLSAHLKSHTNERKYECSKCGSTFKRSEYLRSHINYVHLKLKRYKCKYCGKCFCRTNGRKLHMVTQHKNEMLSENE